MTSLPVAPRPRTPPTSAALDRWRAADAEARPARLSRLRERLARAGVDAYLGVSRENTRYLTGFELRDGEEKVAGDSGRFLVGEDEVVVFADSRYREQAAEQCPAARIENVYHDLPTRWAGLVASLRPIAGGPRVRRVAAEAGLIPHELWGALEAALPAVELVPARGWVEERRAVKDPAELERVAAACAVADAALERLLPEIRPGVTERELAMRLEWDMRSSGADALAFDVACLSGPRAALPHGSPGSRAVAAGEVLLFDFGAQVAGYRSDMTRTLFVGAPSERDRAIYATVAAAQEAAFALLADSVRRGDSPTGPAVDRAARAVVEAAGHGEHFGHGLGHGIGLATHELPTVSFRGADEPLPARTVFSVEPGIYLPGETGVRIEDLVVFDLEARSATIVTTFPREATVVGA